MGSAVWHPEIHFFRRQVLNRINTSCGENVDLLVVELGDVLEIILDAWEGRLTLQRSEHVRLDDPHVDPSRERDVGDVLKSPFPDHGKNSQVVPHSIETNGQIGSQAKTSGVQATGHYADEPGVYPLSNCMADLRNWYRPTIRQFCDAPVRSRR